MDALFDLTNDDDTRDGPLDIGSAVVTSTVGLKAMNGHAAVPPRTANSSGGDFVLDLTHADAVNDSSQRGVRKRPRVVVVERAGAVASPSSHTHTHAHAHSPSHTQQSHRSSATLQRSHDSSLSDSTRSHFAAATIVRRASRSVAVQTDAAAASAVADDPAEAFLHKAECTICLQAFSEDPPEHYLSSLPAGSHLRRELASVSCGHVFHRACIGHYIGEAGGAHVKGKQKGKRPCPLCTVEVAAASVRVVHL